MISSRVSFLATVLCSLLESISARPSTRHTLNETRFPSVNLSDYSPVLTNGNASLPTPNGTLTYITLGRGTQNYSCLSSNSSSVPVNLGGTASLFDVTPALAHLSISDGQAYLNTLPNDAVDHSIGQIEASGLPFIGVFYISAAGRATWNLTHGEKVLYAKSLADIPAPPGADPGPQGYGAIDWRALTAIAGAGSVGLESVWRIETAGGDRPLNCSGFEGTKFQVDYADMYWFYD